MPAYRLPGWLTIDGPVVDVLLSWSGTTEAFEAIIDTGADNTHIPNRLARALNLQQISEQLTEGVHQGQVEALPVYRANLAFEGLDFQDLPVVGYRHNFGLIGRDVLNQLLTNLNGPAQEFAIQRPAPATP